MKYIRFIFIPFLALIFFSFTQIYKKKLLVIGDSISLAYGPELKLFLEDEFDYSTKNTNANAGNLDYPTGPNGGNSRMVLDYLLTLAADKKFHTDLLVLNCGLHDIKTDFKTGEKVIEPNAYKKNLDSIFKLGKKMKLRMIWVNITPIYDSIHNSKKVGFYRYNKDVIEYNRIADSICLKKHIPIIDLYSFSKKFPVSAIADHVHFKPEYAKLQAAYIAGFIENFEKK